MATGEIVNRGVTLKGGIMINIPSESVIDTNSLELDLIANFENIDLNIREVKEFGTQRAVIIEASDVDNNGILAFLENRFSEFDSSTWTKEVTESFLGASFFRQTFWAIIAAFAFMAVVVFIYFRVPVLSFAIILAAVSDILFAFTMYTMFEFKLSTAGIAAFLMLIGYSVDTDILMSVRVTKRGKGSVLDRVMEAMKTGTTMTITSLIAVTFGMLLTNSAVIKEIMTILMFGLIGDLIFTWFQNAGIVRWYYEKQGTKTLEVEVVDEKKSRKKTNYYGYGKKKASKGGNRK
jgi:preprotein translocase subunit SecF